MSWMGAHGRASWVLLVLGALGPPADARTAGAAQGGAAEVLLPAIADPRMPVEEVRGELADLGAEAARELFAIVSARGVVVHVADREVPLDLRPELVDTVLDALAALPSRCRAELLGEVAARRDNRADRRAALAWLARSGEAEDLALALRLAVDASVPASIGPEDALGFEDAAAGCLARSGSASLPLTHLYGEAHPALAAALVRAIARKRSPLALERLAHLLGRRSELDAFVLARFASVASDLPAHQPDSVREPVRSLLHAPLPDVVAAAASVAGLLEDPLAAPRLCALVEVQDPQVCTAALGALRRIAGRDLGGDPASWSAWCDSESAWWEHEASRLLDDAVSGPAADARIAILAIARRRLHRHEQAMELMRCLERSESEVVLLAAEALGALGSPLAIEPLERARRAGDAQVRESARRSLARIAAANRHRD
jgi:HEAT repeat protein